MDGENNGSKSYFLMDDLGGFSPIIFGSTPFVAHAHSMTGGPESCLFWKNCWKTPMRRALSQQPFAGLVWFKRDNEVY